MIRSSARTQKVAYVLILMFSGVVALLAYPLVHPDRVLFRQAEQARLAARESEALSLYTQALALGLNRPHALYRTTLAALQAGDVTLAQQALARLEERPAVERQPASENLAIAGAFDAAGRPDLASALLERDADLVATDSNSALYLADLLRRSQRYDDAGRLYRSIRDRASPEHARLAALQWAEMLGWQEQFEVAEALLREQLEKDPLDRDARILLGRILSWSGRLPEAISAYQQALGERK